MRSDDPQEVGRNFIRRIDDLLRHYDDLLHNVKGKTRQASLEIILAEQMAISIGVYWEAFVHDLIVAYVADDASACLRQYGGQIKQSLGDKFPGASARIAIDLPNFLSPYQAEKVLNPKGRNVTASDAAALRQLANKHLIARHAKRFSFGPEDDKFIDYLVRLRNYLGHRSRESRSLLVEAIKGFSDVGSNKSLRGSTTRLGQYLKETINGQSRIAIIADRTKTVATLITP